MPTDWLSFARMAIRNMHKEASMLDENEAAGDSRLLSDEGEEITLSSFRGKKVVPYFYPRDHDPRMHQGGL